MSNTALEAAADAQRQLDLFDRSASSWRRARDTAIREALRFGASEREVSERLGLAPSLVNRIKKKK